MRMIDADELKNQIRHMPRTINPDLVQYSLVKAIIENMPTLTPPNEPLTIEQLRASPHGKIKDSTLQSICNRANEIACRPPEGEEEA